MSEHPFLIKKRVVVEWLYNPHYGDYRLCVCGHAYYRHFDSYENMANVGCKYHGTCGCEGFREKD